MTAVSNQFECDIQQLREQIRGRMEAGPVTADDPTDIKRLIDVLNDVVATEIVCYQRYRRHAVAVGARHAGLAEQFADRALDERSHASWVAERVSLLGGTPDLNPVTLTDHPPVHDWPPSVDELDRMLGEDLVAERVVIGVYREIIGWIGGSDPETSEIIEDILTDGQYRADCLRRLLDAHATVCWSALRTP